MSSTSASSPPQKKLHERPTVTAVFDGRDNTGDGLARLLQALGVGVAVGAPDMVEPVGLLDERPHRLGEGLGLHQSILETGENTRLKHIPQDGAAVRTALAHNVADTAEPVIAALGDGAAAHAAHAADQQARQQRPGPHIGG